MAFPKVVIERETDSEQSSSEEDEADVEQEEEEALESENEGKVKEALDEKKKGKAPITISLKKVCKVRSFNIFYFRIGFWGFGFVLIFFFGGSFRCAKSLDMKLVSKGLLTLIAQ